MTTSQPTRCKQQKHLMTPVDALSVINRLYKTLPNTTTNHVAFALSISPEHLRKEIKHLMAVLKGDPEACANYNTRRSFMRHLFLLDNSTNITIEATMLDAKNYGNNGNIASKRGRTSESDKIIGVSADELITIQSEIRFLDEEEIEIAPLRLLCKTKQETETEESIEIQTQPIKAAPKKHPQKTVKPSVNRNFISFCATKNLNPNDEASKREYSNYCSNLAQFLTKNRNTL